MACNNCIYKKLTYNSDSCRLLLWRTNSDWSVNSAQLLDLPLNSDVLILKITEGDGVITLVYGDGEHRTIVSLAHGATLRITSIASTVESTETLATVDDLYDFLIEARTTCSAGDVSTSSTTRDHEWQLLCDVDGETTAPFFRRYYETNGTMVIADFELDMTTSYTVTGTVGVCPVEIPVISSTTRDHEWELLCDVNSGVATPFFRRSFETDGTVVIADFELDMATSYTTTGTVTTCSSDFSASLVLCDNNGGTKTPFIRHIKNSLGTVSVTNTTLSGSTSYTVTGTVEVCTAPTSTPTTTNISPVDAVATGAGSTTAGRAEVSVANVGGAAGTWNGISLPAGGSIVYKAYFNPVTNIFHRIGSIAYDATGTTFIISQTP